MNSFKKLLPILLFAILALGCDDGGDQEYTLPPSYTDTTTTILLTDTLSPITSNGDEIRVKLAQIVGASSPSRVLIDVTLEEGVVTDYKVTTSAHKTSNREESSPTYTIKKNDTKTGLAKKFGIKVSDILNPTLIEGQHLKLK